MTCVSLSPSSWTRTVGIISRLSSQLAGFLNPLNRQYIIKNRWNLVTWGECFGVSDSNQKDGIVNWYSHTQANQRNSCPLLRIWALFTSGYNSVAAGVWDYRLRRMWCAALTPPPCAWGGGGGECCHSLLGFRLSHPPTRFTRQRTAVRPERRPGRIVRSIFV